MIIAAIRIVGNILIPRLLSLGMSLLEPFTIIIIMMAGGLMLMSSVGVRISQNLAATVISGIFNAVGYTVVTVIRALAWVIRGLIGLVPGCFYGIRRQLRLAGINNIASNLITLFITLVLIAIII